MTVLLATCVKATGWRVEAFRRYVESVVALDTGGLQVAPYFVLHDCAAALRPILEASGLPFTAVTVTGDTGYGVDEITHRWTRQATAAVAAMKDHCFEKAAALGADAVWFVDGDLVLRPDTLQWLVQAEKPIVAEVFWTRWQPEQEPLPNAWDVHEYRFRPLSDGRLSYEQWRTPGLYPVGGTGACILIRRHVLKVFWNVDGKPWVDTALTLEDGSTQVSPYVILDVPAA